eukprot:TRINITY_DN4338_c0_g1_i1.p1 TRINITY_DN4338_c0_g1~~TRINITY_DN4338_c0_g1_i1.p1  ORF type:complete len:848 (-),score=174.70 TRINITY_DN4338_c0_g1_i1:82-2625(-)
MQQPNTLFTSTTTLINKTELVSPENIERTHQTISRLLKQQRTLLGHLKELQDQLHNGHERTGVPEYRNETIAVKLQEHLNQVDSELHQKRKEQLAIFRELMKRKRRKQECFNWSSSKQLAFTRSLTVDYKILQPKSDLSSEPTITDSAEENLSLELSGPDSEESEKFLGDFLCAQSTSTYPTLPTSELIQSLSPRGTPGEQVQSQRAGDPICDRFHLFFQRTRGVFAVADGCNWGKRSLEAATRASGSFIEFSKRKLPKIRSSRVAGRYLLRAFGIAHNAISEGRRDIYEAGTATILAGVLFQLLPRPTPASPPSSSLSSSSSSSVPVQLVLPLPSSCLTSSPLRELPSVEDGQEENLKPSGDYMSQLREFVKNQNHQLQSQSQSQSQNDDSTNSHSQDLLEDDETEEDSSSGSNGPISPPVTRNTLRSSNGHTQKHGHGHGHSSNTKRSSHGSGVGPGAPCWVVVCGTVGDCKAFYWSASTQTVRDLTQGNRSDPLNASDCGGRLGPHLEGGRPDLRNFQLFQQRCWEGDLLMLMSDGIHDNLDPQYLGLSPDQVEFSLPKDTTWESLAPEVAVQLKSRFQTQLLQDRFRDLLRTGSQNSPKLPVLSAQVVNRWLLEHCQAVTSNSRAFMEKYPGRPLPPDYFNYPGKMDHSTVVTIRLRCARLGLLETIKGPPQTTFVLPAPVSNNLLFPSSLSSVHPSSTSVTLLAARSLPSLPSLASQPQPQPQPDQNNSNNHNSDQNNKKDNQISSRVRRLISPPSMRPVGTKSSIQSKRVEGYDSAPEMEVHLPRLTRQNSDVRRHSSMLAQKRIHRSDGGDEDSVSPPPMSKIPHPNVGLMISARPKSTR